MDILGIIRYIHSSKRKIQDNTCHKLRNIYLEGDAFWSEEWTSNISKSYDRNIQKTFQQLHENIPKRFHNI